MREAKAEESVAIYEGKEENTSDSVGDLLKPYRLQLDPYCAPHIR